MKKVLTYTALALLLVTSMGFVVVGDLQQEKKEESKAYLGVYLGDLTEKLAEKYELDMTEGALVSVVSPGSAANKAGIMHHDVIVAVDGSPVKDSDALREIISQHNPGDIIDVTVVRNGRRQTLSVELSERKETIVRIAPEIITLRNAKPKVYFSGDKNKVFSVLIGNRYHLGVSYQELNKGLGEYFDRPDGDGLLITDVQEESAAAKAGMKPGDVIISVDGSKITNGSDLMNALRAKDDEDDDAETRTFQFEIIRRGQQMSLTVEAEKAHGFDYHYKINGEEMKLRSKELRERLKHFKGHEFVAPELMEDIIVSIPELEFFEGDFDYAIPELEMLMPDIDMMMPDLEMMIPDLEMMMPDFEMMMPDIDMIMPPFEGIFDLDDFEGTDISLELRPNGNVIFNGELFETLEKFREHMKTEKPVRKVKPDTTKVI